MGVPEVDGVVFSLLLLLLMYVAEFQTAESLVKQAVFGSFRVGEEFISVVESLLRLIESLVTFICASPRRFSVGSVGKVCPSALWSDDIPERLEAL